MSDLSFYANYTSLKLQRHPHGVLEVVMSGAGTNKSGLATADAHMHRELARHLARRRPRSGHARRADPARRGQGLLGRRRPDDGRGDDARLRRARARLARGARPRLQRHQLLEADRVGDARPRGRRRPRRRPARRHLDRGEDARASSTATRASASPPATTRRSSGRCCAAWRRRSTTCCCASRSAARRPSASAWSRSPATTSELHGEGARSGAQARRAARRPRSAGPSTRSTTGCAWRARRSTPRSRWNSWASPGPTSRRAWPRCRSAVRRIFRAGRRFDSWVVPRK